MKLFIGTSIIMIAMLVSFVARSIHYNNSKLTESRVLKPLSEVDGYIESMMTSPYEVVFLSIGGIGKDNNYLELKPIDGGVAIRFSAYDSSNYLNKRQAKYVTRLMATANSLAIPNSEKSDLKNDGSVSGINYEFRAVGSPQAVSHTIKRFIRESFQVNENTTCNFRYSNMPGHYTRRPGEEPHELSIDDFVREFSTGNYVYLGEQGANILIIPKELASERPVVWDAKILYADVRQISSEEITRIRSCK
jgi:hypothetical protein